MSDDFDREAEREKLREQYERDQAKREASERMSELLLQGATMTNRHCPECHSPVFTYEGTAFCPTCEREITEDGELAGESGADGAAGASDSNADTADVAGDAAANGESVPTDAGTDGATPDRSSDATPDPESEPQPDPAAEEPSAETHDTETDSGTPREETRPAPARERRPARVDPPARREDAGGDRRLEGGDLADAEAALVREITNLTRRAEETRDVGRKRDFFAAAREAAETLETVRRL